MSFGARVTGNCEPLSNPPCWELNSSLLEEQYMLLIILSHLSNFQFFHNLNIDTLSHKYIISTESRLHGPEAQRRLF